MDEDVPDILQQALLYASALPVSPYMQDMINDSLENYLEEGNHPEYTCINLDLPLPDQVDSLMRPLENIDRSDTHRTGEDIVSVGISEDFLDPDFNQLLQTVAVPHVHSNSTSGDISDVLVINKSENTTLQFQNNVSRHTESTVETDDVKPTRKRRRKREKHPGPHPEPILPPCSVCEEKSSGYHYGVNTCEACKGFFRRTLKKKDISFKCKCKPDDKEAWKRGPFKNGCPACRYKRCIDVGMSKNAIKIGRYTLDHRTKNIMEVKSIEATENSITTLIQPIQTSTLTQSLPETSSSTPGSDVSDLEHENSDSVSSSTDADANIALDVTSSSDDDPSPVKKQKTSLTDPIQEEALAMKDISLEEIVSIVKTLTVAANKTFMFDKRINIPTEVIKKKQKEYSEKYRLKMELFGNMKILSKTEYQEFYQATGVDIDGRLEQVHAALQFFEKFYTTMIGFAKAIPGFRKLCLDDQANLVKASRVESSVISVYKSILRNVDTESRVFTTPWGTHMHLDEMHKWLSPDVVMERRKIAKQLLALNLTEQEDVLIRAILVVSSDRCPLMEPQKVEAIQKKLVTCLQFFLNLRPDGADIFDRICCLLANLREFADKELDFAKTLFVDWRMISVNKYQLLKEFVT